MQNNKLKNVIYVLLFAYCSLFLSPYLYVVMGQANRGKKSERCFIKYELTNTVSTPSNPYTLILSLPAEEPIKIGITSEISFSFPKSVKNLAPESSYPDDDEPTYRISQHQKEEIEITFRKDVDTEKESVSFTFSFDIDDSNNKHSSDVIKVILKLTDKDEKECLITLKDIFSTANQTNSSSANSSTSPSKLPKDDTRNSNLSKEATTKGEMPAPLPKLSTDSFLEHNPATVVIPEPLPSSRLSEPPAPEPSNNDVVKNLEELIEGNPAVDKTIKIETTALIITVTNDKGNAIPSLTEDDFEVFKNGKLVRVENCNEEKLPVVVGLVFDISGSMISVLRSDDASNKLTVIESAKFITNRAKEGDKFFIVNFNKEAFLTQDFTDDIPTVNRSITRFANDQGVTFDGTALIDALYLSLEHIKKEKGCNKKALVVLTDGKESDSFYKKGDLEKLISENKLENKDVKIYFIGFSEILNDKEKNKSNQFLSNISDMSGGLSFFPKSIGEINSLIVTINQNLRSHYFLTIDQPEGSTTTSGGPRPTVTLKGKKRKVNISYQDCPTMNTNK